MKDTIDCSFLHTPLHAHTFENKARGVIGCQWSFTKLAAYIWFPLFLHFRELFLLILRTCIRALNFLLGMSFSALLLCYTPKIDDVFNLSDMLVVFCFVSMKQRIKCSPKGYPSLFPETKVQESVESWRQELRGGRFDKVVGGCTTERVAGENLTSPLSGSKGYTAC